VVVVVVQVQLALVHLLLRQGREAMEPHQALAVHPLLMLVVAAEALQSTVLRLVAALAAVEMEQLAAQALVAQLIQAAVVEVAATPVLAALAAPASSSSSTTSHRRLSLLSSHLASGYARLV
jgi:hypothetical protein